MAQFSYYIEQLSEKNTADDAEDLIFSAAYDKDITTEEYKGLIEALKTRKQWIRSHPKTYNDETEAILSQVQAVQGEEPDDYNTELRLD